MFAKGHYPCLSKPNICSVINYRVKMVKLNQIFKMPPSRKFYFFLPPAVGNVYLIPKHTTHSLFWMSVTLCFYVVFLCCSVCSFLYGPFCHDTLKLDLSTLLQHIFFEYLFNLYRNDDTFQNVKKYLPLHWN